MVASSALRLRAVGYTRVSKEDQRNRPEDDRARITAACVAYGYELVEFIEDIDVSGRVPLQDRENGRRVHDLIEAKRPWADVLVVTAIDRLTRESEDGVALIKRLMPNGGRHNPVRLVSLDDHIDLAGATGRMIAKFRVVLAEYERELIGERTANALQHRRRTGRVYAPVPYGWDRDDDRLVPNAEEQRTLAAMRDHRAAGRNDGWIADWLNEQPLFGKRGGRWTPTSVYRVLRNAAAEDVLPITHPPSARSGPPLPGPDS